MVIAATEQEARNHHFVPKLLLRSWVHRNIKDQKVLCGHYWNSWRGQMDRKYKGLDGFCFQLDLLTLKSHNLGRDAIERIFFGEVDTRGAIVRDILMESGPQTLTGEQRCDFARLLLSLEVRRPVIVEKLRNAGTETYRAGLDNDPDILSAMTEAGIKETPSSYYEQHTGSSFEDIGVATIQRLVDNPRIGGQIVNAHWYVKHLGEHDGSLVLADRPLIRIRGYDHPGAAWVLPLTPKAAFIAVNHSANLKNFQRATPQRFAKLTNVSSAHQAEKYVFSIDEAHERWLGKYLTPSIKSGT